MKEREVMGNIVSPSFKILKTWHGIADVVLRATCAVSEILCEVLKPSVCLGSYAVLSLLYLTLAVLRYIGRHLNGRHHECIVKTSVLIYM